MPSTAVAANVSLLEHVAAHASLPDGQTWPEVSAIFVQAVKEVLDEALEAYKSRSPALPTDVTEDTFVAENHYLVEQLQLCVASPPFTLQRIAEVLLHPEQYHTQVRGDKLRGDVLQLALRKCILVSSIE